MDKLSHINDENRPVMVDVSDKGDAIRVAAASGLIKLSGKTIELIRENKIKKGNVLTVCEIAGVQAAKKTSELIPLCHLLAVSKIDVKADIIDDGIKITSHVKYTGKTGVEMEALTAVSTALLTVYDMCKAVDKNMVIEDIRLLNKSKREI